MPLPLVSATHQAVIPYATELIYKTLVDYDSWQNWIPALAYSRLLTREDVLAIMELGPEANDADALMLEAIETPGKGVLARVIEGRARLQEMEWRVEPAASGFSKVSITVKRSFRFGLRNSAAGLALNPAQCLAALTNWMSSANPGPEAVAGGENLFELWETEAGLVCWIRGRKYKLEPVEDRQA